MSLLLLGLFLALADVPFAESRLEFDSDTFDHDFADVDGDGRPDLLVVVLQDGRRELHKRSPGSIAVSPASYAVNAASDARPSRARMAWSM